MKQCSETSAYEIQTPGNHPKESIQLQIWLKSVKNIGRFTWDLSTFYCCRRH